MYEKNEKVYDDLLFKTYHILQCCCERLEKAFMLTSSVSNWDLEQLIEKELHKTVEFTLNECNDVMGDVIEGLLSIKLDIVHAKFPNLIANKKFNGRR